MKIKLKYVLVTIIAVIIILGSSFAIYVSDYYQADPEITNQILSQSRVRQLGNLTILEADPEADIGFIFYPGGKVEAAAYLPLLAQLSSQGITCILVEMPFHLAVLKPDAAAKAITALPNINHWYIGGHSLGGAMAGSYAFQNQETIAGLILLGAYPYGSYPLEHTLILYGTEDKVLNTSKIPAETPVILIEGGNHSQFGNYGLQKGDGTATITPALQQQIAGETIIEFITPD